MKFDLNYSDGNQTCGELVSAKGSPLGPNITLFIRLITNREAMNPFMHESGCGSRLNLLSQANNTEQ